MPSDLEQTVILGYSSTYRVWLCWSHHPTNPTSLGIEKETKNPDLCNFSNNSSISPGPPMKLLFPELWEPSSYKRAKISHQLLKRWDSTVLSACHTWTSPVLAFLHHSWTQEQCISVLLTPSLHHPSPEQLGVLPYRFCWDTLPESQYLNVRSTPAPLAPAFLYPCWNCGKSLSILRRRECGKEKSMFAEKKKQ